MTQAWIFLKRFLCSPKVILGELIGFAVICAAGASFGTTRLFHSPGFLVITVVTALSLILVVSKQVARLLALRARQPLVGLVGSPIFHSGLLLIIVAAIGRTLFATGAVVDLVEGETLAAAPSAWTNQHPGIFGKAFHLSLPITLKSIEVTRYKDGDLRELKAGLSIHDHAAGHSAELTVNHAVTVAGGRLFLGSDFGPAALLEWHHAGPPSFHEAVLMADHGQGFYEGSSSGSNGLQAHLRTFIGRTVRHPDVLEMRIMQGSALLFIGQPHVGQTVTLPNGDAVAIRGIPFWTRLQGDRDPALWMAYSGFALVLTGATFMVGYGRLDSRGIPCA